MLSTRDMKTQKNCKYKTLKMKMNQNATVMEQYHNTHPGKTHTLMVSCVCVLLSYTCHTCTLLNTLHPEVYTGTVYMADGMTPMHQVVQDTLTLDQYQYGPQVITTTDCIQTGVVSAVEPNLQDPVVQCLVPGVQKCAIAECPNPSHVEEDGTVHKCCGLTHAKEYEQRQCKSIHTCFPGP